MTTLTVKPCKKCGSTDRYEKSRACKICAKKSRDKFNSLQKNKECARNRARKWNKNNKSSRLTINNKSRKKNIFANHMVKRLLSQFKVCRCHKITYADFSPELVEIKRLQMQLHHSIKERERILLEA